jgi:hypothetical protein
MRAWSGPEDPATHGSCYGSGTSGHRRQGVRPENLKRFIDLTCFAVRLMLNQRTLPSAETPW